MKRIKCYLENLTTGESTTRFFLFPEVATYDFPTTFPQNRSVPVKYFDISKDFHDYLNDIYDSNLTQEINIRFNENAQQGFLIQLQAFSQNNRTVSYNNIYFKTNLSTSAYKWNSMFLVQKQLDILKTVDIAPYNVHILPAQQYPYTGASLSGINLFYDRRVNSLCPQMFTVPMIAFTPDTFPYTTNTTILDTYFVKGIESYKQIDRTPLSGINETTIVYTETPFVRSVKYAFYVGTTQNTNDYLLKLYNDTYWKNLLSNSEIENISGAGSPSEPQGGNATYTDTTEPIEPTVSQSSSLSTFGNIWKIPSNVKMREIVSWLINPNIWESFQRLFGNPIDYISGCFSLPVNASGTELNFSVANNDSGVSVDFISGNTTFLTRKTGLFIDSFYDNFLDYSPYTKLKLYLPYIGFVDLDVDYFINKGLYIQYSIDLNSGACVAFVSNDTNIVAMYNGNCASQIPVQSVDYNNLITNSISNAVSIATNVSTGNVGSAVANTASVVSSLKPTFTQSGALSTVHGKICNRVPFLIVSRPQISIPLTYGHDFGFKSNISATLKDLTGFTVLAECDVRGLSCTNEEKDMVKELLTSGIYL